MNSIVSALPWRFRQGFDFSNLKHNVVAGLTVSLVAIPQSLAYAQLAGVPAYYGLYAALIPTMVGAVFGSSRQLSTGPVAMTSMLTAASVAPLAGHGTELFYSYVILLALVSGVFQVLFGLMRMGVLLNFLSHPVLMGFINAAALIIGLSQLPELMGITVKSSGHFLMDLWLAAMHVGSLHSLSFMFGAVAILALFTFRRYAPKFPGVLLTVSVLTFLSYLIGYADLDGKVVGDIPKGIPGIKIPDMSWKAVGSLLPAGILIALISFMEAMSSAKVIAIKTRQPWDENKELIGQGLAKISAAFCSGMPVSGSFSRTALNLESHASSSIASVVSAVFVLLTLLFLTPLLFYLPKPVLAAIIMMSVIGLVNFKAIIDAWRVSRDDGLAAVVTFTATLIFAPYIQFGILIGILLSLSLLLSRIMRPRVAVLGMHHDGVLRDKKVYGLPSLHPRLGALRFDGALRFVNVSFFEDAVLTLIEENPQVNLILVKSSGINSLVASGVDMLRNLVARLKSSDIRMVFSDVKKQVREVMDKTGLTEQIGSANFYTSDQEAVTILVKALAA